MPNPTTGFESQFTPSFNWGNGFSSFDIATQQETLIIGTYTWSWITIYSSS
jgi:hypothetical protein